MVRVRKPPFCFSSSCERVVRLRESCDAWRDTSGARCARMSSGVWDVWKLEFKETTVSKRRASIVREECTHDA